jgi:hypothetical protein
LLGPYFSCSAVQPVVSREQDDAVQAPNAILAEMPIPNNSRITR